MRQKHTIFLEVRCDLGLGRKAVLAHNARHLLYNLHIFPQETNVFATVQRHGKVSRGAITEDRALLTHSHRHSVSEEAASRVSLSVGVSRPRFKV